MSRFGSSEKHSCANRQASGLTPSLHNLTPPTACVPRLGRHLARASPRGGRPPTEAHTCRAKGPRRRSPKGAKGIAERRALGPRSEARRSGRANGGVSARAVAFRLLLVIKAWGPVERDGLSQLRFVLEDMPAWLEARTLGRTSPWTDSGLILSLMTPTDSPGQRCRWPTGVMMSTPRRGCRPNR